MSSVNISLPCVRLNDESTAIGSDHSTTDNRAKERLWIMDGLNMKELAGPYAGERWRRYEKWARHKAACATKPIIPRENRRSRYINHMSLNTTKRCTDVRLSYLRTPHMLEKTARELRSMDRSPPAMTASANGMMISGTNGPMHLSMTLRFSSCASFTSHNTAYELLLILQIILLAVFFRLTVLRLFGKSVVYVYSVHRTGVS